ncbi:flagellar hook-associated protein FlgK [Shewanella sp. A32]|uniref:flagellar hook-associated protein FlgK n=1 Tax=Shewanella sp. A32 TaxID=3031327 RepID=UPI0023B8A0F9|nr:flagellar hook-associated protein FlgK [Shewanella sp. A32]MDF0535734.1 flagellar hook-associated protein FlgK [Shewanella sp. A32]
MSSGLLSNALSGLNAANTALSVSGNNVANSATEGYSRQAIQLATAPGHLNGVAVSNVDRVVNSFYNDDIWRTSSDLAFYNGLQSYLGYAEELMGTSSLNFNDAISQVTGALNSALAQPESRAYRQEVLSSADALVNKMSQINGALADQRGKLSKEMTQTASSISYSLRKLADYNDRIALAVAKGEPTAELEDNRELLVTQLSSYIGIATTNHEDGTLDISTVNGAPLLIGTKAADLAVNGTDVSLTLGKQVFRLTDNIGGSMGGLIAADTEVLQPTVASLNNILSQLSDNVNGVLAQGFDLNGNPGTPLFSYDANDPLGTFAVSDSVTIDSLAFIGGKDDGSGNWVAAGGIGDNSNIANLIDVFDNQSGDYSLLIGRLASKSNENQSSVTTAQSLNDNAVQTRDNLSGVNLDEEASNILYYQQMYQANAKVISTADQTFQTLLAMF